MTASLPTPPVRVGRGGDRRPSGPGAALCSVVERRSMVVRRRPGPQPAAQAAPRPRRGARAAAEGFFAFAWSQAKRDFGFEPRPAVEVHPRLRANLDALDARLRLSGYSPFVRCVVVGLGVAASYAIFCIFFCTREIQNLVYLLWLGGLLHQVVNRPRGVPVQWTRLLVAAAIPAINLFGQWHERIRNGGG